MASINRFDQAQPAQDNYFNTFVPLPLEQLTALGMSRKQDLEKNQAMIDKAYNDVLNIQAIPGSKDETLLKTQIVPTMTDLAMKYSTVDLTDPQQMASMRRELRQKIDPNLINRIEQSHAGYLRYMQQVDKLSQEGKYSRQLDSANPQAWDSANMGAFSASPEAYEGKASLFEPYFNNLKPKDYIDSKNGMIRSEIRPEDVDRLAAANAADLVNTPKGQQELKLFKMNYPSVAKDRYHNDDELIMRHLMNDFGQDRVGSTMTALPVGWAKEYGSRSTQKPLTGQESVYMPLPAQGNLNPDATKSSQLYSADKDKSAAITTQIADLDKQISSVADPNYKIQLQAMRGGLLDQKQRIDDVITQSTAAHAPEIQSRKDALLNQYYKVMDDKGVSRNAADGLLKSVAQEGDIGFVARLGIEGGSQNMSNPLGTLAKNFLNVGKLGVDALVGLQGNNPGAYADATVKKAQIDDLKSKLSSMAPFKELGMKEALDTYLKLHDLQSELEDKVSSDYKNNSYKYNQDMGILMAGSGITDKGSSETDTRTGKLKIPNTSLLLRDLKASGSKYSDVEDITAVDKSKDLLSKSKDIHSFISKADNVSLLSVGSSTKSDGSYPVVVEASKSLGSGKGTETKRFRINLNENKNPYETDSWRNSVSMDLEDKGLYKEADRIKDPWIEKQVLAGKHEPTFTVNIDPRNKISFKNNGNGTYTELDNNGKEALIEGKPAIFTDEQIIQNLYWLKNQHKYSSQSTFGE